MGLLINLTMEQALPVSELAPKIFPDSPPETADEAVTVLMTSEAWREQIQGRRVFCLAAFTFFRGLPGLWVCMDPDCEELRRTEGRNLRSHVRTAA